MTLARRRPATSSSRTAVAASCHGGRDTMLGAAEAAGSSATVARLRHDYPRGPHDQPQSMCPAFGSLRVGLRMRRTATILCGSACCVYGLTFTSHFYGARRTVGYVPFNSETLVTGQLFEDIRNAVFETAKPERYDCVVVINLCVPTASGVPLDRLPKEIDGVRIIGIDVPGFGVPTHAEAKDVLAGAMLRYARLEAEQGPVQRPRAVGRSADGDIDRRTVPGRSGRDRRAAGADGAAPSAPQLPSREWRDLYARARLRRRGGGASVLYRLDPRIQGAGRPVVGSGPVGVDGTAAWLDAIGAAAGVAAAKIDAGKGAGAAGDPGRDGRQSDQRASHRLRLRRLRTAGRAAADRGRREVPYVGTACPRTEWSEPDRAWLEARGTHVQYRASLEQDVAAMEDVKPDLAVGTTPLVQKAKGARHSRALFHQHGLGAAAVRAGRAPARWPRIVAAQTKGADRFRPHGELLRQGRRRRNRRLWRQRRAPPQTSRPSARTAVELIRCWCSIMTGRAATGVRSTPLPRSAACGW